MRILIINTDYGPFLRELYEAHPGLAAAPYATQLQRRNESLFGVADFYSRAFRAHGHEAWEVHANNGPMQAAWMSAHRLVPKSLADPPRVGRLGRLWRRVTGRGPSNGTRLAPVLRSPLDSDVDLEDILIAQARVLRPHVVLNQAVSEVPSALLERMRPHARLIIGQIASSRPDGEDYRAYDFMISSLPNFVRWYRELGVAAELNRLAFDPAVLDRVRPAKRDVPVSFVGSVTREHAGRLALLERLAVAGEIDIWGRLADVPESSPIWRRYRGSAWGRDMYDVLGRSKITINQHIDLAEDCANNMRLFEATGMGTLLVTDWKPNIGDMFVPGEEVVCYRNPEECLRLVRYYLDHEDERARIAAAGQRRTLRDHGFGQRAAELVSLFAANCPNLADGDRDVAAAIPAGRLGRKQNFR